MAQPTQAGKDAAATQAPGARGLAATAPPPPKDADKTETATVLGDVKPAKQLGQVGMGAVYLAHQISLDRQCALKLVSQELSTKPGLLHRFKREARSMAKIDHPNFVKCYAVDEEQGHY